MDGVSFGLWANAVTGTAYLAVAALLLVAAIRTRQWRTNPLGVATAVLFVGCGGGHAVHALQLFDAQQGLVTAAALGAGTEYGFAHVWAWDIVVAGVGVWYWTMRGRFPGLVTSAAVFEDLRIKQKRALEINDNIVQGLVRAKLSIELHRDDDGRQALLETFEAGERIISDLERPGTPRGAD